MASSARKDLSPRAREIVDVALDLLAEEGPDRLGIRAPSIYKHLPDKQALEAAIISAGFEFQAEAFEHALKDSEDPLGALACAYRRFAKAHPHLYRLMTERELQRDMLTPGVESRAALPVYEAVGRDPDLARAAWAFAHGMTILELDRRFPPDADLDAAWDRGIRAFTPTPRAKNRGHRG